MTYKEIFLNLISKFSGTFSLFSIKFSLYILTIGGRVLSYILSLSSWISKVWCVQSKRLIGLPNILVESNLYSLYPSSTKGIEIEIPYSPPEYICSLSREVFISALNFKVLSFLPFIYFVIRSINLELLHTPDVISFMLMSS